MGNYHPAFSASTLSHCKRRCRLYPCNRHIPNYGKQAFHLTIIGGLIAGAISTFCIYVFIRIIITLIKLPRIFRGLSLNRRARTADKQFSQAELALLENKPAVAEDLFLTAAKGSKSPNLCYVGAARAAQISGNIENRNRYLREIDMSKSKHDLELAASKKPSRTP